MLDWLLLLTFIGGFVGSVLVGVGILPWWVACATLPAAAVAFGFICVPSDRQKGGEIK